MLHHLANVQCLASNTSPSMLNTHLINGPPHASCTLCDMCHVCHPCTSLQSKSGHVSLQESIDLGSWFIPPSFPAIAILLSIPISPLDKCAVDGIRGRGRRDGTSQSLPLCNIDAHHTLTWMHATHTDDWLCDQCPWHEHHPIDHHPQSRLPCQG